MRWNFAGKIGVALGVAAISLHAESAPFKIYGFSDFRFSKMWLNSNNLLIPQGYLEDDANFYLGHVDPYIDWNPNEHVRGLVEMNLNPEGSVSNSAGTRLNLSAKGEAELRAVVTQSVTAQVVQQLTAGGMPLAVAQQQAASIAAPIIQSTMDGVKANSQIIAGQPAQNSRSKFFELVRAQVDLKIDDAVNFRIGRFLTPVGIWSVDHGSPVILSIQQPYYISVIPIFPQAQEGGMLFGNATLGDNDLSYSLYMSKGREDNDKGNNKIEDWDDLSVGGQTSIKIEGLNGTRFGVSGYVGRQRKDDLWGDGEYEMGLLKDPAYSKNVPDALKPALAYLNNDTLFLNEISYSRTRTQNLREYCWALDTKTGYGHFNFQAELSGAYIVNENDPEGKSGSALDYYLLASWDHPLNDAITLTPYLFYEELTWSDQDNVPGWSIGLEGFPLDGFRTMSVGLNTTIWSNIHLKTEYTLAWLLPNSQLSHPFYHNHYTEDELFGQGLQAQLSVAF